jgi:hypothetical protein
VEAIRLESDFLELMLLPACGGKIISLRRRPSGREWLWRNPHLPPRRPTYGADYNRELDSGGWDEIFPSVSPCRVTFGSRRDVVIPDHGEVVGLPWQVKAADTGAAQLSVECLALPFRFIRHVRLAPASARVEFCYQLQNLADEALPFLWTAHPLLNLAPGMRLGLPAGTRARVAAVAGGADVVAGSSFLWPRLTTTTGASLDLSVVPDPQGPGFAPRALKVFTERLEHGRVMLAAPDDEQLAVQFDPARVGHVGLWLNYLGWSGTGSPPYFNLGLEPTTAPCGGLDQALCSDAARWLLPGERRGWWVSLTLDRPSASTGTS